MCECAQGGEASVRELQVRDGGRVVVVLIPGDGDWGGEVDDKDRMMGACALSLTGGICMRGCGGGRRDGRTGWDHGVD